MQNLDFESIFFRNDFTHILKKREREKHSVNGKSDNDGYTDQTFLITLHH